AEDGIRDDLVTGVQTCALPIYRLGAQGTVAGGGRYDFLFSQLGGDETPACGFAVGVERLALLLRDAGLQASATPLAYVVHAGSEVGRAACMGLSPTLRGVVLVW